MTVWEKFLPQLKLIWSGGISVLMYLIWPVKALPKILVSDFQGTMKLQIQYRFSQLNEVNSSCLPSQNTYHEYFKKPVLVNAMFLSVSPNALSH